MFYLFSRCWPYQVTNINLKILNDKLFETHDIFFLTELRVECRYKFRFIQAVKVKYYFRVIT